MSYNAASFMVGRPSNPDELHPLVKDRIHRPNTVFHPGSRIKMNIMPMIVNLFLPWFLFCFCMGLCSSWIMYRQPGVVIMFLVLLSLGWIATARQALRERKDNPEPSWWTYLAITTGLALVLGTICGMLNFQLFRKPFFLIRDLKIVRDLDVRTEYGQNQMDAGMISFRTGTHLDSLRSWHFKQGTLYCVAPIVLNNSKPLTQSYDFWAVGADCCSMSSSDFRCGDWDKADAKQGTRLIDEDTVPFYRLAVKQAETLYGIVSAHPIFVEWSQDPTRDVQGWNMQGFHNFVFCLCLAFVVSLACLTLAITRFAWMGRGGLYSEVLNEEDTTYTDLPRSAMGMDPYMDPRMGQYA